MDTTANGVLTTTFTVRPDQIERVDDVKGRRQKATRESVSRSEVVRDALDRGLPLIESDLDAIESTESTEEADDLASPTEASIRGP